MLAERSCAGIYLFFVFIYLYFWLIESENINVFTVSFDQFNVTLLNKNINYHLKTFEQLCVLLCFVSI